MPSTPSIHYTRRWYYVLWSLLLAGSAVALGLWETPAQTGTASLSLNLRIAHAPEGCTALLWAGPKRAWPTSDRALSTNQVGLPLATDGSLLGFLKLRVAYRRWTQDYIPRRTDDLVVLKIRPRVGPPRYYTLPLEGDWHSRLLRPGQRMQVSAPADWADLWQDPALVPTTLP